MRIALTLLPALAAGLLAGSFTLAPAHADAASMSFFVTSAGPGHGGNLGGLEGADAWCNQLAKAAGSTKTNWHAYLSTTAPGGDAGINARDRIGKGPWVNVRGDVIAKSVEDLHSDNNNLTKDTALSEKGDKVFGRGDKPNTHDMLTGSDPQGMYSTAGGDTTCKNWTSETDGSAIVGHHDRMGLKDSRHMKSWNSAHGSAGCSQEALVKTGGAGLFYCFAAE
ncbi:MAG: lectin [Hyphomicrobiales bacterium]